MEERNGDWLALRCSCHHRAVLLLGSSTRRMCYDTSSATQKQDRGDEFGPDDLFDGERNYWQYLFANLLPISQRCESNNEWRGSAPIYSDPIGICAGLGRCCIEDGVLSSMGGVQWSRDSYRQRTSHHPRRQNEDCDVDRVPYHYRRRAWFGHTNGQYRHLLSKISTLIASTGHDSNSIRRSHVPPPRLPRLPYLHPESRQRHHNHHRKHHLHTISTFKGPALRTFHLAAGSARSRR